MKAHILILVFFFLAGNSLFAQESGVLKVNIENIETYKGQVLLAIYKGEESWLKDGGHYIDKAIPVEGAGKDVSTVFEDLPYGEYGIALFQDYDNNEKLDKNWLGVPTEPYGFSGKPESKWRKPKYQFTKFSFQEDGQEINLRLHTWKDQ